MAPESPSSSWDERERSSHDYRNSPGLNLNQLLISQEEEYQGERDGLGPVGRRAGEGQGGDREDQVMDAYDDDHHAREKKTSDYETSSRAAVIGLDLNIGHSSPELPLRKHSPNLKLSLPPLSPRTLRRGERSASPSPPTRTKSPTSLPARRKSPSSLSARRKSPSSHSARRRSSHKKQHCPSPGRRSPSPTPREPSPPLPPSKRLRIPAGKRSPSIEPKRYSPSPVRRRTPSPGPARKRSPHVEEKRRSVTPLKRRGSPAEPARKSPSPQEKRRSQTPLKRRAPSVEAVAVRKRSTSPRERKKRSLTPLKRRAPSREPARRRSPSPERRRPSVEGTRKRDRSGTPTRHRERSRTKSPGARRSPSPSRRSRSPAARRRSPRRSPRRDRSSGGRFSPRRRSSPSRTRGSSRRERRPSPGSRRAWSPPQNRSNGVGKPGNNLFIAGFNFITTERDLERKFARYGRVMDVRIVRDKRSGESRGFGFLTLERDDDADAAIKALDQTEWNGRIVLVEKAKTPTRF